MRAPHGGSEDAGEVRCSAVDRHDRPGDVRGPLGGEECHEVGALLDWMASYEGQYLPKWVDDRSIDA